MNKPLAVIIGDIHFTPGTLELATTAFNEAKAKARDLKVPLIVNGDTLDTKALMRAECVNRLIELVKDETVEIIFNVGNHDLVSEKSSEHTLNFLKPYCRVIDTPTRISSALYVIPYQTSLQKFQDIVKSTAKETLIVHQGVQTAFLGHYVQDKTSSDPKVFEGKRVIGSHYHRRQHIKCGETGTFDYIGNPYTLSFGEAEDGPKGFIVLYKNNIEFCEVLLRRHKIIEVSVDELDKIKAHPHDLLQVKVHGDYIALKSIKKDKIASYVGHSNFKLDFIADDKKLESTKLINFTPEQIFDKVIDNNVKEDKKREQLKLLWRKLLEA